MVASRVFYWLLLVAFTVSACAISNRRGDRKQSKADAQVSDSSDRSISDDAGDSDDAGRSSQSNTGTSGDGVNGGAVGDFGFIPPGDTCGNGVVDGNEQCDDGNLDQDDGCTTQCEFSCVDDADCDDLDNCNGVETCTEYRACDDSDPDLEEGIECGEDKSCWRGVCVPNACGDAKRDPGERCDDGNLDPDDGCTPDCELTCEDDGDCVEKDECLGERRCRDDGRHRGLKVCVGGTVLDDETVCTIKDTRIKTVCGDPDSDKNGWCLDGVCTCSGCGDGEVNGDERCDDGSLNGTTQSPNDCSISCRVVTCQNYQLDGDEECDDGNDRPVDGCDPECKYELAHRFTDVRILKDVKVPKWCKHRNNRFADAFSEEVRILGVVSLDILEVFNRQYTNQIEGGDTFYVLHVIDSNDTSMKTVDDDVTIGLYRAYPYTERDDPLDWPLVVEQDNLDRDTRRPVQYHAASVIQAGGGRILSNEPTTVEFASLIGDPALIHDYMMQLVFDVSTLSSPSINPAVSRDMKLSQALRIPEVAGQDPEGLFCGAIGQDFGNRPLIDPNTGFSVGSSFGPMATLCCKNRGDQFGMPYRYCHDGVLTDQCESVADLVHQGCSVCIDETDDVNIADLLEQQTDCHLMQENPDSCIPIINGVDSDVDTDGDGVNDSWSALFGFATQRVRIYDVELNGRDEVSF